MIFDRTQYQRYDVWKRKFAFFPKRMTGKERDKIVFWEHYYRRLTKNKDNPFLVWVECKILIPKDE